MIAICANPLSVQFHYKSVHFCSFLKFTYRFIFDFNYYFISLFGYLTVTDGKNKAIILNKHNNSFVFV
nr:MAG TPA: hypothetical protein [Caudoviricetes sp.]